MSAIGYREIAAYLDGKYDLDTAVSLIKKRTFFCGATAIGLNLQIRE